MESFNATRQVQRRLKAALLLNTVVILAEMVGGISANSLGLISDAIHNFIDEATLLLTFYAYVQGARPASNYRTFGYHRTEVMAAWINSGTLIFITFGLIAAAVFRMLYPAAVHGRTMWMIGLIAFLGNLGVALVLRKSAGRNINIRSVYLHNLGDALISLSPVAGGLLISTTGWTFIDPLISLMIGASIILGSQGIFKEANVVLLKGTPTGIDAQKVAEFLRSIPEVRNIHDLHIWSESPQLHLLTCQLLIEDMRISEADRILKQIRKRLFDDFRISHATIQLETASCHPQLLYCNLQRRLAHRMSSVANQA